MQESVSFPVGPAAPCQVGNGRALCAAVDRPDDVALLLVPLIILISGSADAHSCAHLAVSSQ